MPVFQLTPDWQKVASAGQTVEVMNLSAGQALIMTSSGGPPAALDGLALYGTHPSEQLGLTTDLYARSTGGNVTLEVMSGIALVVASGTAPAASPAGTADFSQPSNSALIGAIAA